MGGYVKKLLGRIVTFFEVFLVWVANCFTLVFFSPKQEEEDDRLGRWSQYQSDVPALILFLSFVFLFFFKFNFSNDCKFSYFGFNGILGLADVVVA